MNALPDEKFRAGVGVLIVNPAGLALAIERTAAPGAWQFPQGGLLAGETCENAALREMSEETGLGPEHVSLRAEYPEWLPYELPESYRSAKTGIGQVQRWFLFDFTGADADVVLPGDGEARAWRWMELGELATSAPPFRRAVYGKLQRWVAAQRDIVAAVTVTGGCLCGRVRYRAIGVPRDVCFCHCSSCRRAVGAPAAPWATFDRDAFSIEQGELATFASSPGVVRGFCATCGTSLTYSNALRPGDMDVTLATLDEVSALTPGYHIWVHDSAPWVTIADGLPVYGAEKGRD